MLDVLRNEREGTGKPETPALAAQPPKAPGYDGGSMSALRLGGPGRQWGRLAQCPHFGWEGPGASGDGWLNVRTYPLGGPMSADLPDLVRQ